MVVQYRLEIPQGGPQTILLEICTPNEERGKVETLIVPLQHSSVFQHPIVVAGCKVVSKVVGQGTEAVEDQLVDVKDEKEHSASLKDQSYNCVDHTRCSGGDAMTSWRAQGCGVETHAELLLKVQIAGPGTESAADKGIAAQPPVRQTAHPNSMPSLYQPSPVIQEAAHHPAGSVHPPCCGAQPTCYSKGCGAHERESFIGTVACPPSTDSEAAQRKKEKEFRGIRVVLSKKNGGVATCTATQDTGSNRNVVSKRLVDSLGYTVEEEKGPKTVLWLLDGLHTHSKGVVKLPFRPHCKPTERQVEFHVVESLGSIEILLSLGLTMQLGHLLRLSCPNNCGGP